MSDKEWAFEELPGIVVYPKSLRTGNQEDRNICEVYSPDPETQEIAQEILNTEGIRGLMCRPIPPKKEENNER